MGQRRKARELAVQFLYQLDTTGEDIDTGLESFKEAFGLPKKPAVLFSQLVTGVISHRDEMDSVIERCSHNWRVDRMTVVDRNILRLAVFEMLYLTDVPDKVSINEAVELAKDFGSDESPAFINGVLDAVRTGIDQKS